MIDTVDPPVAQVEAAQSDAKEMAAHDATINAWMLARIADLERQERDALGEPAPRT